MSTCWKHIALELNIPEEIVEKIDVECTTISDKCFSVFSTWRKMFTNNKLCWCRIVNAFQMAGLKNAAEQIKESHLSMYANH